MKLRMHRISYAQQTIPANEFGYVTIMGGTGFNPTGIDAIVFRCPNGTKRMCMIGLTLGPQEDKDGARRWHWDGNMESPTVTPSIGCMNRCGWHGNITDGDWITE